MLNAFYNYLWVILGFAAAILIGYFAHLIIFNILKKITDYTSISFDKLLIKHLKILCEYFLSSLASEVQ